MDKQVRLVAGLHIGFSILGFLGSITIYALLNLIGDFVDDKNAELILSIIATAIAGLMFFFSIPGFIAGLALFKYKEWARIVILIISALNLVNFPIGTALGAYSIWVLVQKETSDLFNSASENSTNPVV